MEEKYGINKIGDRFQVNQLDENASESRFNIICYVTNESSSNGNGGWDVLFSSPITHDGWSISAAKIGYNWGDKHSNLKICNPKGIISDWVTTDVKGLGSRAAQGRPTENHKPYVIGILDKFIEIVTEYPSVEIYNYFVKALFSRSFVNHLQKDDDEKSDRYWVSASGMNSIVWSFHTLEDITLMLKNNNDMKSQHLLIKAQELFIEKLKSFFSNA